MKKKINVIDFLLADEPMAIEEEVYHSLNYIFDEDYYKRNLYLYPGHDNCYLLNDNALSHDCDTLPKIIYKIDEIDFDNPTMTGCLVFGILERMVSKNLYLTYLNTVLYEHLDHNGYWHKEIIRSNKMTS